MSNDTDARLSRLEAGQADIKATLARLEPMLVKLIDGQEALKADVVDLKVEMAETKGRVAEQSSILQLVIASRMGRKPAA